MVGALEPFAEVGMGDLREPLEVFGCMPAGEMAGLFLLRKRRMSADGGEQERKQRWDSQLLHGASAFCKPFWGMEGGGGGWKVRMWDCFGGEGRKERQGRAAGGGFGMEKDGLATATSAKEGKGSVGDPGGCRGEGGEGPAGAQRGTSASGHSFS